MLPSPWFLDCLEKSYLLWYQALPANHCAFLKALTGAQSGIQTLEEKSVPWLRPPDYYAEMVKSDGHMANIKQRLVYEQKQIEEAEERFVPSLFPQSTGPNVLFAVHSAQ